MQRSWLGEDLLNIKCIAALALCACLLYMDVEFGIHNKLLHAILSCAGFFQTRSVFACACYILMYIGVQMVCLPITPIEIFTGFCFGVRLGLVVDLIARLSGATLSFNIARLLLYAGVDFAPMNGQAVLQGVGRAVQEHGLRFLVLFNLAYVPVAIKNYGLGFVPEVPITKFLLAILITEVPMGTIWSYAGSVAAQAFASSRQSASDGAAVSRAVTKASPGSMYLKVILVILGLGSILTVLWCIHSKVDAVMQEMRQEDEQDSMQTPFKEDGLLDSSSHTSSLSSGGTLSEEDDDKLLFCGRCA